MTRQLSVFTDAKDCGVAPEITTGEVYRWGKANRGFEVYANGEHVGDAEMRRSEGFRVYTFSWNQSASAFHNLYASGRTKSDLIRDLRRELDLFFMSR